jgi:GR25 family glycosyltransferase involved in LPS biosynthesis
MIEGIVYINLEYRKDRKAHIVSELANLAPLCTNVHRIDAVLEPFCGHIGCGKSHVKALELAIEQNWDSVLIVEDDLQFTQPVDELLSKLTDIFTIEWDVILLGHGYTRLIPSNYEFLQKCLRTTCAHGYIVRKSYYPTLLECFNTSVKKMTLELEKHSITCKQNQVPLTKLNICSAIDQEWFSLQQKDIFYCFVPVLGIQRKELYSDNNCSIEKQTNKINKSN